MKSIFVLLAGGVPLWVQAMSVGEIELQSYFGQPLRAEIAIPSATADELETLNVNLAPSRVFEQQGVALTDSIRSLRFIVEKNSDGKTVVMVSSTGNFHELAASFYVEFKWRGGQLIKGYDLLVSPPVAALTPSKTETPVVVLKPSMDQQFAPTTGAVASGALQYGPVKSGDVLSLIAQKIRPDRSIALQQMMLALYEQNPQAFEDNNINLLKRGSTLTIDNVQSILRIDAVQARAKINEQTEKWKQSGTSAVNVGSQESVAPDTSVQSSTIEGNTSDVRKLEIKPRLQILTGEESLRLGGSVDPVEVAALNKEISFLTEEADSLRKENEELQTRLEHLEEMVRNNMKRMEAFASNRNKVSIISKNEQAYTDDLVTAESDVSFKVEETSYMSEIFGVLLLLVGLSGIGWLFISRSRPVGEGHDTSNWWGNLFNRLAKKNTKTYIG